MERRILSGFSLITFLSMILFLPFSSSLAAEKYPSRPIELICGFSPGGSSDLQNRTLAKFLEKYLKVPVIPVNKPGAGGLTAVTHVTNAPPDGYTIGQYSDTSIFVPLLRGQMSFPLEDIYVVCQFSLVQHIINVTTDSQWKTFQEFVDYARNNPGVKYAHAGIGSHIWLRMENLNRLAKLKMIGVPLRSGAESLAAVLGKHVPVGGLTPEIVKPHEDAGKLRTLFSFDPPAPFGLDPKLPHGRSVFGDLWTDIECTPIMTAPKQTPKDIMQVLQQTMEMITKDPEFVNYFKEKFYSASAFQGGKTLTQIEWPKKIALIKEILQDVK
jgi:tripartite-type tricarboxylate transporter receptor subunit TctC